ncbi:beta-N-acetylhexosaminidase [Pseudogracilibacillus sp. SE30717A]|uniref:beta-N-acetylhexosaminidase n=1 Tax=Pseudogracilibacillus sp. SE30717A TaxID=3098293 RepID=UPI00300DF2B2
MRRLIIIVTLLSLFFTFYLILAKKYPSPLSIQSMNKNGIEVDMPDNGLSKEDKHGKEAHEIISDMTLDEKIGQLIVGGIDTPELTEDTKKLLHTYKLGGFILFSRNLREPEQSLQLISDLKNENSHDQLPLFLSVDQEGGKVVRLPNLKPLKSNWEIGEFYQENIAFETGKVLGRQLKEFGLNMNFAPVIDINSNPDNPVIGARAFGSDKYLVSELGIEMMKGMHNENVIAVVKHFPGHGDTSIDSHEDLPKVDKNYEELNEIELFPFNEAINAGAEAIMTAHILLPNVDSQYPATLSETIITGILRENLGFEGVIITDDLTMGAILKTYEIGEAAVMAIEAGADIVLIAHQYENVIEVFNALKEAVKAGRLNEERVDESLFRILTLKGKYDIQDNVLKNINVEKLNKDIDNLYKN